MKRYGNIEFVLNMPLHRSLKLIEKASEEDKREIAYRLWLVRYPRYTSENYETPQEFYEKMFPPVVAYDMRPKDEIMEEVLQLQRKEE